MIRKYYSEIKFYKTKYKIYKIVTEEKTFFDITKYIKRGLIWSNVKMKNNSYYLRFDSFNDVIKYVYGI